MEKTISKKYVRFTDKFKQIIDLQKIMALLNWDREVMMPVKGSQFRSEQTATIATFIHKLFIDPELEEVCMDLQEDYSLDFVQKRNIEEALHEIKEMKKYPVEFVSEYQKTTSEAFLKWKQAKTDNDFLIFSSSLEKIIELKLKESELLGYNEHPYDALLDQYERGLTTSQTESFFNEIKPGLKSIIDNIGEKPQPDTRFLEQEFDTSKQMAICKQIVADLGYDFSAGRLDLSPHPFSISFGPRDVRITTRLKENDMIESLSSAIHEAGHALYEQGIPKDEYGKLTGQSVSLSIHESQSRLYENNIGRSYAFVDAYLPLFKSYFPSQLKDIDTGMFYNALNIVKPGMIRTASDELTYHFHIIIRFEIEKALIEKNIKVKELPEFWNAKYKEYLNVDVDSDSNGVLQDIHWAHGSFGYFPTYSMGSFYAAQFFNKIKNDIGDVYELIVNKDFLPILLWLRHNIHKNGKLYMTAELCKKATDEYLNTDYFINYAIKKFGRIYDI